MSDTSRYIWYTFVRSYASCPVQSTSKYLLKLLNKVEFVAIAVCYEEVQYKIKNNDGKSVRGICNVSDFRRTIFKSVSWSCLKNLAGNHIESKNVCKVKLSNILFM